MKELTVSTSLLSDQSTVGTISLRNEPVQARSTARLAGLLDAAAAVVDELGYERLTTAMVAERAGASIGTVYRYFPDRIAVLQALAARNLERTLTKVTGEISNAKHTDWAAALNGGLDIFVEAFRNEPGFRSLRVGDVIDLRPNPNDRTYNSLVAEAMLAALAKRFDIPVTDESRFAFEVAIEISDALAARAFAFDSKGQGSYLDAGRDAVQTLLAPHFGSPV
jgi:AcrR family transcriptional regulator